MCWRGRRSTIEVVNSILNYAMAKKLNKQDLKDLKESIDRLYAEEEPEEEAEQPEEAEQEA